MRRIIVAGGRDFNDFKLLVEKCNAHFVMHDVLISGACASGADFLAEKWAITESREIKRYPANWKTHGRAAGPIRNKEMAENADVLIAFWDGESRGTKSMIHEARRSGLEVHVYPYKRQP